MHSSTKLKTAETVQDQLDCPTGSFLSCSSLFVIDSLLKITIFTAKETKQKLKLRWLQLVIPEYSFVCLCIRSYACSSPHPLPFPPPPIFQSPSNCATPSRGGSDSDPPQLAHGKTLGSEQQKVQSNAISQGGGK